MPLHHAVAAVRHDVRVGKPVSLIKQAASTQWFSRDQPRNAGVAQGVVSYHDAAARSLYPKEIRRPV